MMSLAGDRLSAALNATPVGRALALMALLGLALVPLLHDPLNRDVAWLLHMSERFVDGGRLYVDVVDNNPPLIVWLGVPAVLLARMTGMAVPSAWLVLGIVVTGVSLAACNALLARIAAPARGFLVLAIAFAFISLPGRDFGERESIALILFMPYALAAAARLRDVKLSVLSMALLGVAAGIGISLKPFFLLPFLAVEALVLLRLGARQSVRPELIAALACMALYVLSIPVLAPEYLETVRVAAATYSGVRAPWLILFLRPGLLAVLAALVILAVRRRSIEPFESVTSVAMLGFLVGAFVQGKGWEYHYIPAIALALLVCAWRIAATHGRWAGTATLAAALGLLLWPALDARDSLAGAAAAESEYNAYMAAHVRQTGPEPTVVVLGNWLVNAFPMVSVSGAEWGMRYNGLWFLPGLADGALADSLRTRVVSDIDRSRPDLIIVELPVGWIGERPVDPSLQMDFLGFLSEDPRFAVLLREYEHVEDVNGCRILRRAPGAARPLPPVEPVDTQCGPTAAWVAS